MLIVQKVKLVNEYAVCNEGYQLSRRKTTAHHARMFKPQYIEGK